MRIHVRVRLNAREEKVEKEIIQRLAGEETLYRVSVRALPIDGKANIAVIKALAAHFKTAPSRVQIVAGHASREKIVELN
ncbi:DUF167 domain-containing protein [Patescibacteria group bacterium]|nr:DUF167 domain-containing protein [Patescibacteria group bacterium]